MLSTAEGPSARSSYPSSPGEDPKYRALGVCTPSSAASLIRDDTSQRGSATGKPSIVEKELEVERLWWSEASERQVTQLESTFTAEFQKTCKALRTELLASKDKLETMVQEETRKREADVAELRQLIEGQNTMLITEVAQRKGGGGDSSGGAGASAGMQIALQELRSELFAVKDDLRGTKDEWHKVQFSSQLESLMSSLTEMWPRLGSIETQLEQQASLSKGLEALEAKVAAHSAREGNVKEARTSLSALEVRVEKSEGMMQKLVTDAASLASRCKALEEVPAAEDKLQSLVEQEKLRREAGITELRSLVEGQAAMVISEVRRQTQADQDKLQVMFEEEKSRREMGLAELRHLMDGQQSLLADIQQAQQRTTGGVNGVEAVTLAEEQSQTLSRVVYEMQDVRSQLVTLKEEAQGAKAESRQSKAASSQLESLVHTLENDANRQAKLLEGLTRLRPRLETVEDKIQQQSVAFTQLRISDEDAKSSKEAIASVTSRTDQLERCLRISGLDSSSSSSSFAFADKLKHIEGEVASLSRSGVPLMKEVKALLQEYLAGAVVEAKTKDGVASASSVANSTVERQNSSRTSVAQSSSLTPQGTDADENDELGASVLAAELKDLKLLLQPIQAAAAESRVPAPAAHPTRQMSGGSLSPRGGGTGSSSVDWWDASAIEGLKPTVFRDLKESMASLVSRVNDTLSQTRDSATSVPSSQAAIPSSPAWGNEAGTAAASTVASQQDQSRFLKALQAVRDLREVNTDLRARNAQLAERLSHDVVAAGPVTPSSAATERAGGGLLPDHLQAGKSPKASPRVGNLLSSTSGNTTPQHGVQRIASIGQPLSSAAGRTLASGLTGTRPLSLQASTMRSPGRLGMGPNPTPQLRTTSGLVAAAGAQGSKPITPTSSQLASGGLRPTGGRVLPTTSRPGPLSR